MTSNHKMVAICYSVKCNELAGKNPNSFSGVKQPQAIWPKSDCPVCRSVVRWVKDTGVRVNMPQAKIGNVKKGSASSKSEGYGFAEREGTII